MQIVPLTPDGGVTGRIAWPHAPVMPGRPRTTKSQLHPNRVAEARARAGLTQDQLATGTGMDWRTLGKLERGESRLRWEQMVKIARALKCSPFELPVEIEGGLTENQAKALQLLARMDEADQARWLSLGAALLDAEREPRRRRNGVHEAA